VEGDFQHGTVWKVFCIGNNRSIEYLSEQGVSRDKIRSLEFVRP
jgi:hypothetical protein